MRNLGAGSSGPSHEDHVDALVAEEARQSCGSLRGGDEVSPRAADAEHVPMTRTSARMVRTASTAWPPR